ncbi:MAG: immunity 49 family protein [Clostridia bacterium]|nr:immunity 49 family protein [Clostridia bacterium]
MTKRPSKDTLLKMIKQDTESRECAFTSLTDNEVTNKSGALDAIAGKTMYIAISTFLLGNTAKSLELLNEAVEYYLKALKEGQKNIPPEKKWIDIRYVGVSYDYENAVHCSIIASNLQMTKSLLDLLYPPWDTPLWVKEYPYALKYYFNGEYEEALKLTEKLEQKKGEKKIYKPLGLLLKAIIQKDRVLFGEALTELLKIHHNLATRGNLRYTADSYICLHGLALAKLAQQAGIQVEVENDYMPKTLFE